MHFENRNKLTSHNHVMFDFSTMFTGHGKWGRNGTEAVTLAVSILQYFKWVEFLGKWPEHFRGDALWKSQKIDISYNDVIFDFSTMFTGHAKWCRSEYRNWYSTSLYYPRVLLFSGVSRKMAERLTRRWILKIIKKHDFKLWEHTIFCYVEPIWNVKNKNAIFLKLSVNDLLLV